MKTLQTTAFLREHGLAELCERYKIIAKRHGEQANLVQLKYSQVDSPMGERIVQECRGLILDEANDWAVVACPYFKFFNYGEGHAAPIDWTTAKVYEKLDGSLMTVYAYSGKWHVASSGLPDASGPVNGLYAGTFADLFWKVWADLGYALPPAFPDNCFMFELMTPYNRVVCKQGGNRIVLHGWRHLGTLVERDPELACHGWECVRTFDIGSLDGCIESACQINPMDGEGYIVRDADFNRIKVKSPQYVALAHMKEGFSGRRMLDLVRANESSEFLAHFPEYTDLYGRVREAFDGLCAQVDADFASAQNIADRKGFALVATKTRCPSAMFAIKDAKAANARGFFAGCTTQVLERVIGIDLAEAVDASPSPVRNSKPLTPEQVGGKANP